MLDLFLLTLDTLDSQSDRDFLVELYQNHKYLVFSIINQIVHQHTDAEDIMQEVFIRMIPKVQNIKQMEPRRRIAYIAVAAKNLSFDHLARKSIERKYALENQTDFDFENMEADVNIENQVLHSEKLQSLLKIWPELSETDRYILRAKYILDESDAEIATKLGVAVNSVRMKITRARQHALALMQKEGAEP